MCFLLLFFCGAFFNRTRHNTPSDHILSVCVCGVGGWGGGGGCVCVCVCQCEFRTHNGLLRMQAFFVCVLFFYRTRHNNTHTFGGSLSQAIHTTLAIHQNRKTTCTVSASVGSISSRLPDIE